MTNLFQHLTIEELLYKMPAPEEDPDLRNTMQIELAARLKSALEWIYGMIKTIFEAFLEMVDHVITALQTRKPAN